jgi:hypothetical protein
MSLPDQTPKLPKLPFLIGDAALLILGWFIANRSGTPLGANAIAAVTACVAVGALLGVIPFLTDYARKQDEALDERQRGLEALSRTINTAAEQISIAANGLNELTDLTHKNLKHAEQLPHKLQDKISEFKAQLDNAREDDREELEKEIAELRASETERLQTVADKIHKAVGELSALDLAAQKHITARTQLLERAGDTIVKAQTDAAVALADAVAAISKEIAAAQARALAEIDAKLAERTSLVIASLSSTNVAPVSSSPEPAGVSDPTGNADPLSTGTPSSVEVSSPPRRPRKSRREEPSAVENPQHSLQPDDLAAQPLVESMQETAAALTQAEPSAEAPASLPQEPEPAPVPTESIQQIKPIAPVSADPFVESTPPLGNASTADTPPPRTDASAATGDTGGSVDDRPLKKRSGKQSSAGALTPLPLNPDDDLFMAVADESQEESRADERGISSDGATRLIATAYIGIGNRLFIRGEGPGLSWEKGVPLQFISIGKWRWETVETSSPIPFKLYKNDAVECTGLGLRTLDVGHQHEVTAKF